MATAVGDDLHLIKAIDAQANDERIGKGDVTHWNGDYRCRVTEISADELLPVSLRFQTDRSSGDYGAAGKPACRFQRCRLDAPHHYSDPLDVSSAFFRQAGCFWYKTHLAGDVIATDEHQLFRLAQP